MSITREERIARERGLAAYARAAQQSAEALRELFGAIEMMGGQDPLALAPLFADAYDALVDPEDAREAAQGSSKPRKLAHGGRSPKPYEIRAQEVYEALPGTVKEIADALGDITSDGVHATLAKMKNDPAWASRFKGYDERRRITRSDGRIHAIMTKVYYPRTEPEPGDEDLALADRMLMAG